ncbi:MAG: exodeoxyribonuclease VII small subunit [Phascolarctobacterium sp.]|nr:exodeoxyribonuclease VII small subunit [Phascolarctobacterium sp.]
MAAKKIAKNIKFEDALAELEEQVRLLESGELSLEDSLDVYKYGVELSKICTAKLDLVKQEVEKIVINDANDAGFELEPFQDLEVK